LVIPKAFRRSVAVGGDPLDADGGAFEQGREKLAGQVLGHVRKQVRRGGHGSIGAVRDAMPPEHVSTYKSSLLRKRKGRRGRKPKGEEAPVPASSAARGAAAISLRDLRALKELADRLGGTRLREIAELVS
jgi:hypothetical protein